MPVTVVGNTVYGTSNTETINLSTTNYGVFVVNIEGNGGNDTLKGNGVNNVIRGGNNDDRIYGENGMDSLYGGAGNDRFYLKGEWSSSYNQPGGLTHFYTANGPSGTDFFDGGPGIDRLVANEHNLTLVLTNVSELTGDSIEGIINVGFSNFTAFFQGSSIQDFSSFYIENVRLEFAFFDNEIIGSAGNDVIDANNGVDTVIYGGDSARYTVTLEGPGQIRVFDSWGLESGNTSTSDGDILIDVERVQFADGVLDLTPTNWQDTDATAGDAVNGIAGLVAEGTADGTAVGIDVSVDPSSVLAGATVDYALVDSVGGMFAIDPATGVVTLSNSSLLDYQNAPEINGGPDRGYTITVEASTVGFTSVRTFTVLVTPGNDAPNAPVDTNAGLDHVVEGAATGTLVGITAQATDPNGNPVSYSLSDNDGGRFQINASTGVVSVLDGSLLDYEASSTHYVTVRATDSLGAYTDGVFAINLDDAPVETWTGTSGNDTYTLASLGDWTLNGLDGNDTLTGNDGANVTFVGAGGNDTLTGKSGNDIFRYSGTAGGSDAVVGGDGYDVIQATAASTTIGLSSISEIEEISGGGFAGVALQFGAGNDVLDSNTTYINGIATIRAGAGNDTIIGTYGNETILGEDGNDFIQGGSGADVLNGGIGTDTVSYAGSWNVLTINLATNTVDGGDATGDTITGFENVIGSDYNDSITGSSGANVMTGGAGDDVMSGGGGNDTFRIGVGSGVDAISGGTGTDTVLFVEDNAVLMLSSFASVEAINASGVSNATIAGTELNNTFNFSAVTMTNVAGIFGLAGNDTVTGSAGADIVIGGDGNDILSGGNGDDIFRYEDSDEGFDNLNGGGGTDTVEATASGVTIGLSAVSGIEIFNGYGDTILLGSTTANTFNFTTVTLNGIASIDGGGGNDTITGTASYDIIYGGSGADRLSGYLGSDVLFGDAGNDIFDFNSVFDSDDTNGSDTIADFVRGQDKIDVTTIDANANVTADQNFTFIGTGAFTGTAGQLRYQNDFGDGYTHVFADVNGDSVADLHIYLQNIYTLSSTDFVL